MGGALCTRACGALQNSSRASWQLGVCCKVHSGSSRRLPSTYVHARLDCGHPLRRIDMPRRSCAVHSRSRCSVVLLEDCGSSWWAIPLVQGWPRC